MNLSIFKSKKGQVENYAIPIIFLFVFGFSSILGYLLMNEMISAYATTGVWTSEMAAVGASFLRGIAVLDYLIVILMVGLIVSVIITSYRLNASAAFFVISLLLSPVLGFVSYFMNYMFAEIVSQPQFVATLLFFPRTVIICTNLHWISLVTFVVGSIALYAKKERGNLLINE